MVRGLKESEEGWGLENIVSGDFREVPEAKTSTNIRLEINGGEDREQV